MAYIVKAQYGRYIINDESYSSIFVTTGNTIIFDVSHFSNADHPLKISTTKDGTHGVDENGNPGTELDDATAIVNNGVPGEPNAQIMFTPALDGIFYYYCEHHANMGSSITSVQTKFTDLGATAYDAQDGDITNRITKKIYKKDENNLFQLVASINDSHGNPWEVSNIDITEQASYKIEYNAKGLDNIDASNQPLERYINIITAPGPTLPADYLASQKACDVNADLTGYLYDDDHYVIRYTDFRTTNSSGTAVVYEFYVYGSEPSSISDFGKDSHTYNTETLYFIPGGAGSLFTTNQCGGYIKVATQIVIPQVPQQAAQQLYTALKSAIQNHTLDSIPSDYTAQNLYKNYIHSQFCSAVDSRVDVWNQNAIITRKGEVVTNRGATDNHVSIINSLSGTGFDSGHNSSAAGKEISIYPIKESA